MSLDIDTVDFSPFLDIPVPLTSETLTPEQRNTAQLIDKSFREYGFLFLKNFGLSEEDLRHAFTLSKELFDLPLEHKMSRLKRIEQPSNIGYVPYRLESLNQRRAADLKEAYNYKSQSSYKHDFCGCPPGFEEMTQSFWEKIDRAALNLATACAVALNLPFDFFRKNMKMADLTTFRFIHYPPCEYAEGLSTGDDLKCALRVGEHTDFGMFTLLFTDGPGLQVKSVQGGTIGGATGGEEGGWRDVPMAAGATAVVNTGALMARWTNDSWKATAHRVVVRGQEEADCDRYSIACFYEPDKGAIVEVDPSFVADGDKPKYPAISGYAHLQQKLQEAQGGERKSRPSTSSGLLLGDREQHC